MVSTNCPIVLLQTFRGQSNVLYLPPLTSGYLLFSSYIFY